ncbi:hypothetical protein MFIFM68171_06532 [Madurella fahalii]|uniref:BTB domain-containing protein n=1 Tax=Madurella fahalii TaxID=1157608 RepID=A0ABQ0GEY3_9PEZI
MEDTYFETSRFSSGSIVKLRFKRGHTLNLHQGLLQRSPKLARELPVLGTTPPYTIDLGHISRCAGHVLVAYLYTDQYHTLKWTGPGTGREETLAKLKTGFEVYITARAYDLDGLEELAKEQISLLSNGIDPFAIIDIARKVYPSSDIQDTWFPTYMKEIVKRAFEEYTDLPTVDVQSEGELSNDIPITKILLRSALEVHHEIIETIGAKKAAASPELPTLVTSSSQAENVISIPPMRRPESVSGEDDLVPRPPSSSMQKTVTCNAVVDDADIPMATARGLAESELVPEGASPKANSWDCVLPSKKGKKNKKGQRKGSAIEKPDEPAPTLEAQPEPEPVQQDIPLDEWIVNPVFKLGLGKQEKKSALWVFQPE